MSQASAAAPAPAPAPAPVAPAQASLPGAPSTGTSPVAAPTPTVLARMRLGLTIAIVLVGALLAGLLAAEVVRAGRADADTAQLIRVQEVKANLLRADALATNAFLIGGLEPAAQRAAYDDALDAAVQGITEAAAAQGADTEVLTALSQEVSSYSELMGQARANNRQGKPVGAAYLRQASTNLRSMTLPLVEALITANKERSDKALSLIPALLLLLPALLAIGLALLANRWIGKRFRRRINVGLAIAVALLAVAGLASANAVYSRQSANDELKAGAYAAALDASTALSAANDARAYESLRLVERGSGSKWETPWKEQAATVQAIADRGAVSVDWSAYADVHGKVIALDESGDWDQAVALSTKAEGSNGVFTRLDSGLRGQVDSAAATVSEGLGGGTRWLLGTGILALLLALAAAAMAWRGITARLEEYS